MSLDRLCIVEFHRPNFKLPTFAELIGSLVSTFNALGVRTTYRQDAIDGDALNIVFGAHRVFQAYEDAKDFPGNCVFFNLEGLYDHHADRAHRRYVELMKRSRVIDYSPRNVDLLRTAGNAATHRFGFGYTPLTHLAYPPRESHLLFFGVPTDRRKLAVEKLVAAGLPLRGIVGYWGYERDYEICTARAVVNISKYDDSVLEIYRLWHSLCLGTPVVSEKGIDHRLVDEWREHVRFVDRFDRIDEAALRDLPDAARYRENTSFREETARLLQWLSAAHA